MAIVSSSLWKNSRYYWSISRNNSRCYQDLDREGQKNRQLNLGYLGEDGIREMGACKCNSYNTKRIYLQILYTLKRQVEDGSQVQVAVLGLKGINVNAPSIRYHLRSLPGDFSGLHLLCLQYVAFKQMMPDKDIGFDLSAEYRSAQALHQVSGKSGS